MEKILLALDSRKVDVNAVRFASYLSRLTRSRLTGLFLESPAMEEVIVGRLEGASFIESITVSHTVDDTDMLRARQANIGLFREIAEAEGIQAAIDLDTGIPAGEIIAKSRFADIVVLDASTSFSLFYENTPSDFVKDVLQDAECPVILAPQGFTDVDNIVFCYNGSKSSVFAIKQFIYLFPELRNKHAKVLCLGKGREMTEEEEGALADWLAYHYSNVEFLALENDSTEAFIGYLLKKKNDFVVMGAYGKGLLASFYESGLELEAGQATSVPVFVAHY